MDTSNSSNAGGGLVLQTAPNLPLIGENSVYGSLILLCSWIRLGGSPVTLVEKIED